MGIRPSAFSSREAVLPCPVMRFDAGSILTKLEQSGLLAKGRAHIISLDAVRAAMGERWNDRKDFVWDLTEAQILKRIGEQDFSARLSESDFIVITPKMEPAASQILAVRISTEILNHFLGKTQPEQISIKVVTAFVEQEISCRPITTHELAGAIRASEKVVYPGAKGADQGDKDIDQAVEKFGVGADKHSGGVTTLNGVRLRFSTSVDPIIDLTHWAIAGHRVEPKILYENTRLPLEPEARRQLLPRDVEAIDVATLRRGLKRLDFSQVGVRNPSLILSISFLTVSNTRSRTALFEIAHHAKSAMMNSVIWEITDFEAGVPASRLQECFSLLSPYGRTVFARAEPSTLRAISERSLGRCGLIFQPPANFRDEDEASIWLMETSRLAAKRSTTLIAANLPSKDLLPLASSVGFTHATLRSLGGRA